MKPVVVSAEYWSGPAYINIRGTWATTTGPGWVIVFEETDSVDGIKYPQAGVVQDHDQFNAHYRLLTKEEEDRHELKRRALAGNVEAIVTLICELNALVDAKNGKDNNHHE